MGADGGTGSGAESRRGETDFADRVRAARQKIRNPTGSRMTQGDLAVAVGVERNTVSRWENRGIRPKDPEVMRKLAAALRVKMEWLVSGANGAEGGEDESRYGRSGVLTQSSPRQPYANDASVRRLPPRAYEAIDSYLTGVEAAGGMPHQVADAERVLREAALNRLRSGDPQERPLAAMLADIESAWEYVAAVLRRDGRAV
jgi:transcriptional regulator with XRE-family HTH domain